MIHGGWIDCFTAADRHGGIAGHLVSVRRKPSRFETLSALAGSARDPVGGR